MDWKKLLDFGLSVYEAKCYLFLAREGVSSPSQVSAGSDVPYGRVYDVLKVLEKRGFVEKVGEKPIKYLAVPPSIVLKKTLNVEMKRLEKLDGEIEELVTQVEVSKKEEKAEPRGRIRIMEGKINTLSFMTTLHRRTKEKWDSIASTLNINTRYLDEYTRDVERGVHVRVLIHKPYEKVERAMIWKKTGAEFREIRSGVVDPPARFSVADDREVVLRFGREPEGYWAVWIREPGLTAMMKDYFDRLWKEAERIDWKKIRI